MHTHRCVQTQEMHADTHTGSHKCTKCTQTYICMHTDAHKHRKCMQTHAHGLTGMQELHRHTHARTQAHNAESACTHTHSYMHADTHARANLENALERCRHTHMQACEHFCNTPFCDFSYWQLFQMKRQNPHPPGPP